MSPLEFGGVVRPENGVLIRIHDRQWLVPSQSELVWRLVEHATVPRELSIQQDGRIGVREWRCSCPAWVNNPEGRGPRFRCRHVDQVLLTLEPT